MTTEPTTFAFEHTDIRTVTDQGGEPWFVLGDVLKGMRSNTEVKNSKSSVINGLGDDQVDNLPITDRLGRPQETTIVTEAAATFLVSRSNTDTGRRLNRFIHTAVLPELRKKGSYQVEPQKPPLPDFTNPSEAARAWADERDRGDQEERKRLQLEQEKADLEPYAKIGWQASSVESITRREWVHLMHSDCSRRIKENELADWLEDHKYCYRDYRNNLVNYSRYSDMFTVDFGYTKYGNPFPILKILGKGVSELTGRVIDDLGS